MCSLAAITFPLQMAPSYSLTNACHWSQCQNWAGNVAGAYLWKCLYTTRVRSQEYLYFDFTSEFQYQMMVFSYFPENVTGLFILVVTRDFINLTNFSGPELSRIWQGHCWRSKVVFLEIPHKRCAILFRILHDCMLRATGQLLQPRVTPVVYAMKCLWDIH